MEILAHAYPDEAPQQTIPSSAKYRGEVPASWFPDRSLVRREHYANLADLSQGADNEGKSGQQVHVVEVSHRVFLPKERGGISSIKIGTEDFLYESV